MSRMPTGFLASQSARALMANRLGDDLLEELERIGRVARDAYRGDQGAALEMRRLRYWIGPVYWQAMCLMLIDGRITKVSKNPAVATIRTYVCRDALILSLELQAQREAWGMGN